MNTRLNILVVDDKEIVRDLLSEMIKIFGHNVLVADSGSNALEILKQNRIDLIISDVKMPEMNGYELFCEVRKLYPQMVDKFIFMTGGTDADTEGKIIRENIPIFCKPLDVAKIERMIAKIDMVNVDS